LQFVGGVIPVWNLAFMLYSAQSIFLDPSSQGYLDNTLLNRHTAAVSLSH